MNVELLMINKNATSLNCDGINLTKEKVKIEYKEQNNEHEFNYITNHDFN